MRKLIVISAGLLALTAFTAMSAGPVRAAEMLKKPDCLGEYLTCLAGALQDAFCCAHPDATQCAKSLQFAPQLEEKKPETCQQLFHDDVNGCDDDFVACVTALTPPAKD